MVAQSVYDDYGRLSEERFFDNLAQFNSGAGTPAETVVHRYDAFGRQVAAVRHQGAANGTVVRTDSWAYDAQGRLTAAASPEGTIAYAYDALGRKTSTTAGNKVTSYTYDNLGRLATVWETIDSQSIGQAATYEYDLDGQLDKLTNPNGVISDYVFDTLGRLDKLTHYAADATPNTLTDNAKLAETGIT